MTVFDLRDTIIPFSLLQISNHFKRMKPGEVMDIICPDAAIENDLRCILPQCQCETRRLGPALSKHNGLCIRFRKI